MSFFDKLEDAIARNRSLLVVGLEPNPEIAPLTGDWRNWLHSVIDQTYDRVCAYKPTLGFYLSMGSRGLELLLEVLGAIPDSVPVILDAKHSDLNTSTVFAKTIFEKWVVDAVTLNPYAGQDQVAPFLLYPDKSVFILTHTANPPAKAIQNHPSQESPLSLKIVQLARTWGTPEQVALEVGTTDPEGLTKVRAIAPERLILARSIWGADNITSILAAGLNKNGEGLLIPVPLESLGTQNLSEAVASLNLQVDRAREAAIKQGSRCELWMPDVCLLQQHPHQDLILQLFDLECILFGDYLQASGTEFPYYIDLRKIISNPQVFEQVINAYSEILKTLRFDRIAGIPYGALPTATGLSMRLNYPMIFPRKEVKAHGTRRLIEGHFQPGETVVVVDDILISGKSAMEGAAKLQSAELKVEDIVVFIDHEGGVKDRLRKNGYQAHSVLSISEITQTLYEAGKINSEQYQAFKER